MTREKRDIVSDSGTSIFCNRSRAMSTSILADLFSEIDLAFSISPTLSENRFHFPKSISPAILAHRFDLALCRQRFWQIDFLKSISRTRFRFQKIDFAKSISENQFRQIDFGKSICQNRIDFVLLVLGI